MGQARMRLNNRKFEIFRGNYSAKKKKRNHAVPNQSEHVCLLSLVTVQNQEKIREQISLFSLSKTDLSVQLLKVLRERKKIQFYSIFLTKLRAIKCGHEKGIFRSVC